MPKYFQHCMFCELKWKVNSPLNHRQPKTVFIYFFFSIYVNSCIIIIVCMETLANLYAYYARFKALSHGAIFLATCNAILLLVDVKLANTRFNHSLLIYS